MRLQPSCPPAMNCMTSSLVLAAAALSAASIGELMDLTLRSDSCALEFSSTLRLCRQSMLRFHDLRTSVLRDDHTRVRPYRLSFNQRVLGSSPSALTTSNP